jgi:deoxycytidine triphosphate deaminase
MAQILPDREIRKLLKDVIAGGDPELINPNGIELRLGKHVRFLSTGEEKQLEQDQFLKVCPGETVLISSLEKIDFTRETVSKYFPESMLMAFITPTTTMMREGIAQVSTKIDAGFRGNLNWSLRNGSAKDLIIQHGESIFKLTIFCLEQDEAPEVGYGEGPNDQYQDTEGIKRSKRRIPADLSKKQLVSSSFDQLDPKKQLREAGYPFDHIGSELVRLDGKFEMVSRDVAFLKNEFEQRTKELSGKIEAETKSLTAKLDETKTSILEKVGVLFHRRFTKAASIIIGAIPLMYAGVVFLQTKTVLSQVQIAYIAGLVGAVIIFITWMLTRKS